MHDRSKQTLLGVAVTALALCASARVPIGFRALAGTSVGDRGFDLTLVNVGADGRFGDHARLDVLLRGDLDGVGVEEAAVEFADLPLNLELRMGLLRSRFGIDNERRQSESWFTDRPLALDRAFSSDWGLNVLGLDLALEIPAPWTLRAWLALTEGGGRGQRSAFAEAPMEIDNLSHFGYQAGLENLFEIGEVQLEFDLHGVFAPNDSGRSNGTDIYGAALGVTWRPDPDELGVAVETEWMFRRRQILAGALQDVAGWLQANVYVDAHWSVGARWDFTGGLRSDDTLDPGDDAHRYRGRLQVNWSPLDGVNVRLQGTGDAGGPRSKAQFGGMLYVEAGWSSRFFGEDD